jgi:single-strand DNA-binding protein
MTTKSVATPKSSPDPSAGRSPARKSSTRNSPVHKANGVDPGSDHRNDVRLVGRLSAAAVERELPSGDVCATWRLVVRRPTTARAGPSVDTIDCLTWIGGVRRQSLRWQAGDVIEVEGALRRRFWRSPGGPTSRCEVEVRRGRRVRAAGTAYDAS